MRHLWLIARWAPLATGLWWSGRHYEAPWYVTACLAVTALTLPGLFLLGVPAAGAAWYLGAPPWLVLAAACYRFLYEKPLGELTMRFVTPPVRTLPLGPRPRCRHVRKEVVRRADTDMGEGRPASALDRYLRALAEHPAPYTDSCVRVLLTRAAEAAVRSGCPQIAAELATGALHGLSDQPTERALAVVAARAGALRAQALGELSEREAAAHALQRAQQVPHSDGPTAELVRTTAIEVHFHDTRPGATCDQEQNTAVRLLNEQQLGAGNRRVLMAVHMIIGRRLLRAGRPAEAVKAFAQGTLHSGVPDRTLGGDSAFQLWRTRIGPRWRGAVRLWLAAVCEQMLSQVTNGERVGGALREEYEHCVALAPSFEDPLLTARLTAYHAALTPDAPGGGRSAVRHPMEDRPFVFADRVAQGSWAALHAQGEHPRDLSWWAGAGDPARLREAARSAEAFFARLGTASPRVFAAMHGRAADTARALTRLLDEPVRAVPPARPPTDPAAPPAPSAAECVGTAPAGVTRRETPAGAPDAGIPEPRTPATAERIATALARTTRHDTPTDSPGIPSPPPANPHDPSTAERIATALAKAARQETSTKPPGPRSAEPAGSAGRTASGLPATAAGPPGRFGAPEWLAGAEALTGGRSWTLLMAVAEAHLLGHSRVGTEHLLMAVLDDPLCAALLEPFGVGRSALRQATSALLAPYPHGLTVATLAGSAREVLEDAGAEAARHGRARRRRAEAARPLHILAALLRQETGTAVSLLTALGAEPREALARADHWLYADHAEAVGPPPRWIPGLPDPRPFTARARAVLVEAAYAAHHGGPAGLLGVPELAAAVGTAGFTSPPSEAAGVEAVRLTPTGRRALAVAVSRAHRLGHPGACLDDLAWAVANTSPAPDTEENLPAWDAAVAGALSTASAAAQAEGFPYVAPEHLSAALETDPVPPPPTPLPLTPLSACVLAAARARAEAAKRPVCDEDDLRHALAAVGPRPSRPAEPAPAETPPLLAPGFERFLRWTLDELEKESTRAASRADVTGLRRALRRRTEMLRFLALADYRTYEPLLVTAVATTAHQLGAGPVLEATLRQAVARARALRTRTPGPAGLLAYAGFLMEAGTCLSRLDRYAEAAPHFAEAARVLHAHEDESADSLRGQALLQHAQCAVRTTHAQAAVAPVLEAAGHRLTAAADGGPAEAAALPETALFAMDALADLGAPAQALDLATRTLWIPGLSPRNRMEVHIRRAGLLLKLDADDLGVADLTAAVLLAPDDPRPVLRRGELFLDLRRFEEALADFDRASELAPRYPAPRHRRGQALVRTGAFTEALSVLDDATRNFPYPEPPADVLLDLAAALRATGRAEESVRVARTGYAEAPDFPWFRYQYALSLHMTGAVRHGRLHLGEAIRRETERWRAAARRDPDAGRLAGNLTVYFAALGAARQSRRWLRTAVAGIRHSWAVADLREDLNELARTIPSSAALCADLTDVLDTDVPDTGTPDRP
ncbi:hypothetical protein GCM10010297_39030 [Streptomyces malachitofuscus]|nr:hypothetical protein GCM10010297_39030 [Streptomyces malachitofuscus]